MSGSRSSSMREASKNRNQRAFRKKSTTLRPINGVASKEAKEVIGIVTILQEIVKGM